MSRMSEMAAEQQQQEREQQFNDMEYFHYCVVEALRECRAKGVSHRSIEDLRVACGISVKDI